MGEAKGGGANTILMVVIALLIGLIGGYFIGQGRGGAATTAATPTFQQQAATQCPHDLDAKDRWILAGFRCPGTDSVQVLTLDCHCPTSHGIRDKVKSELAAGKSGEDVRAEIEAEYGDRLKFSGQ